ncbi:hypothetical protein DAH66_12615 [Sphingomonas koreensis]|uniref:Type VI secretion system spike protein VgrG3-like C-terminal domain-containing protein n=1 Tax=Sphingomonas koreensis TaxID=93064 RepID=A0A430G2A7_9SPHN|nr:hypothetical protein [Sphingomonas koreensis]RSY83105.1 hypothetical protein DAH66_12615 [Sphingomonas koreensis]
MSNRKTIFAAIRDARPDRRIPGELVQPIDAALTAWGVPLDAVLSERLGELSMKYETGHSPGQEALAAAKVSSGKGDPGGKSYGAYQLASLKGQVAKFLKAEGLRWAAELAGADPAKPGAFEQRWKAVAAREPAAFFDAQHAYIERTHYQPVAEHAIANGLDVNAMPKAVRDAVWSMSVQHGGAKTIVSDAILRLGGNRDPRTVLNALYDARLAYVRGITLDARTRVSLVERYASERADAIRMVGGGA